jgi:hypothetical protein
VPAAVTILAEFKGEEIYFLQSLCAKYEVSQHDMQVLFYVLLFVYSFILDEIFLVENLFFSNYSTFHRIQVFLDNSKENKVLETTNLNYDEDEDEDDYSTINSSYEFKGEDNEAMEVTGYEDDSSSVVSILSSVILHPQANSLILEAERTIKNNENFRITAPDSNEMISPSKAAKEELRLKMKVWR